MAGISVADRPFSIDMATVLVVDDDAHIREVARFALARAGHAVELATDGARAAERIERGGIELVVLDILMPELDGLALCRRLRARGALVGLPIVLLSSRGEEADRVLGLELGADDYLTKPFSPRELVARISSVLRRSQGVAEPNAALQVGAVRLEPSERRVYVGDREVPLTATEFDLLACLMRRPGRVFSREQLLDAVWGRDVYVEQRTVDVHIRRLRSALAPSKHDEFVHTVRGSGYRFARD